MRASAAAVLATVVWLVLGAGTAQADPDGVIVRGESLTLGAIGSAVPLGSTGFIRLDRLRTRLPTTAYDDAQLLVHDLSSGTTRVADPALAQRLLIPLDGGAPVLLDGLLGEPGLVVGFESSQTGPPDALRAERFSLYDPLTGRSEYLASLEAVPEPRTSIGLLLGTGVLAAMGSSRRSGLGDSAGA